MVQELSFGSVRENDSPFLLLLEKKNIEDYIFFCHKSSIFFLFGFCFLCENMEVKVLMLGPKNKMLVFFLSKYRRNIGYRPSPTRYCQPKVDWPKNQEGKIADISTKF